MLNMKVLLNTSIRLFTLFWTSSFLLYGLHVQSGVSRPFEYLNTSQDFETNSEINISMFFKHDINSCHLSCNKLKPLPGYCDLKCPVLGQCCEEFSLKCRKTFFENQTRFISFANSKMICKYKTFIITRCPTNLNKSNSILLQRNDEDVETLRDSNTGANKSFLDEIKTIVPVTDLVTGFTYINLGVFKRHTDSRSEPVFWNIKLQTDQMKMLETSNKFLNINYLRYMDISFEPPEFLKKRNILAMCDWILPVDDKFKFSILMQLHNTVITVRDVSEGWDEIPGGWQKIQCDVLTTSDHGDYLPCQVKACNNISHLIDGQCQESKIILLAYPVALFSDFNHTRILNYITCYLYEHSNLHVNESLHLPAIDYIVWRKETYVIFTLKVLESYMSNNKIILQKKYFQDLMIMSGSMVTIIRYVKATGQNLNFLLKNMSIDFETINVCFAMFTEEVDKNISELIGKKLVCSDVLANKSFVVDKNELQVHFSCRQHLGWTRDPTLNTASLLSKYVIGFVLFFGIHIGLSYNVIYFI